MYKRLVRDASLYSISSLLGRGLSLITVPIFTRILTPADYGALDLLSYLVVLVPMVMGAALDSAVERFYTHAESDLEKKRIASTVLFYTVFVFVALVPAVDPLVSYLAHGWLDNQVDEGTVALAFLLVWIHAVFYIANNQLVYLFLSKQYAICNVGNAVVSAVLGLVFVLHFDWGIYGIFLGQAIGQGLFTCVSLYYGRETYALIFHFETLKRMLRYSLPLVPATFAFFAMQCVDRYVINEIGNLSEVGLYGIGARLASLLSLFLMGFQGAWNPIVMRNYREIDAPERFATVFSYYLFIVCALLVVVSLFGEEILLVIATKTFSEGFVVVPLLTLSVVLASVAQYFTYGITIAQKSHYRLLLYCGGLVANIILNVALIPSLGIVGAALATAISFLFVFVVAVMLSQKLYYVPYRWVNIGAASLLAVTISNAITVMDLDITLPIIIAKLALASIVVVILSRLLNVPLGRKLVDGLRALARTESRL